MKIYKIRSCLDKTLFSNGGALPHWTKKGKAWTNPGHITNHFHQLGKLAVMLYANAEIVTYEVVEASSENVLASLTSIQEREADKLAKKKAAEAKRLESEELQLLEKLQKKYQR